MQITVFSKDVSAAAGLEPETISGDVSTGLQHPQQDLYVTQVYITSKTAMISAIDISLPQRKLLSFRKLPQILSRPCLRFSASVLTFPDPQQEQIPENQYKKQRKEYHSLQVNILYFYTVSLLPFDKNIFHYLHSLTGYMTNDFRGSEDIAIALKC